MSYSRYTRHLLGILSILALVFCGKSIPLPIPTPGPVILYAQSVPTTVTAKWTANAPADGVVSYVIRLEDGTTTTALPTVCVASVCTKVIAVNTFGTHSVTIVAQNQKVSTDPTNLQTGLASPVVTFTLFPSPGVVTGTSIGS